VKSSLLILINSRVVYIHSWHCSQGEGLKGAQEVATSEAVNPDSNRDKLFQLNTETLRHLLAGPPTTPNDPSHLLLFFQQHTQKCLVWVGQEQSLASVGINHVFHGCRVLEVGLPVEKATQQRPGNRTVAHP
jgi:hypothetical protein